MKKIIIGIFTLGILGVTSCSSDDGGTSATGGAQTDINEFIWSAMNSWYYWQDSTANLSDGIGNSAYANLINSNSPEELFPKLLNSADDFSWLIDDYVAQENSFAGIYQSYGFEYGLYALDNTSDPEIFGYVRYVLPGTSAESAGIERGDLFLTINGTQLKASNYSSLLNSSAATFGLASIDSDNVISLNGETKTANLATISENPVFLDKVIDVNGTKVGYLVFNSFVDEYHDELNDVFGRFQAEGIQELVLDLRYNGGGSVLTSSYLASMIVDNPTTDIFAKLTFNNKHTKYNDTYPFADEMELYEIGETGAVGTASINRLGLTKLYVIGTGSTASASEMIINGLRAYIDVELIGSTTVGKNEGSITLYDIPATDYLRTSNTTPNPDHTYAIQPIVFQIFNANNQNDYGDGFQPDIKIYESDYLDNLLPLGDPEEPLLNAALTAIDPSFTVSRSGRMLTSKEPFKPVKLIGTSKDLRPHSEEMYIKP